MTLRKSMAGVAIAAGLLALIRAPVHLHQSLIDSSCYAPGYREWEFRRLRVGMSEADVIRRLGPPLRVRQAEPSLDWTYGPPTLRMSHDGGLWKEGGPLSIGLDYTSIRFDPDRRVAQVNGDYLGPISGDLVGLPLGEVRERFGKPRFVLDRRSTRIMVYSETRSSESYFIRDVGLDATGRVVEIASEFYYD